MNGLPLFDFVTGFATVPGCTAEPCAGSVASGPGLSKGHTVTDGIPQISKDLNSYLHVWEGAGLLRVKNPYTGDFDPTERDGKRIRAKRGEIKGHSSKSQSRARQFLAKIPNEAIMGGLLVTLTYPGKQAADKIPEASEYKVYKEHLRRFNQSVVRVWKGSGAWFLEFQSRGAPHYHLIVFGVDHSEIEGFQNWVSHEWNRIVDGGSDHLKAGTRVEIPKNCQAARNYVTAYFTKGSQALEETKVGRYWGKFGTASIPISPEGVEVLTPIQATIATRTARRAVEHRSWASAWTRLHMRAGKLLPSLRDLTTVQFRTLCQNCRKQKGTVFVTSGGLMGVYSSVFLEVLAFSMGVERIKFPRRYHCRKNSTINLYCNASEFGSTLKRHPRWNEVPEVVETPLSPVEALRSYLDLFNDLKESYLSADFERVGVVLGKLAKSGGVLGYQLEEDWNDVTKTLFISVRSSSGTLLFDHQF
jgi:hypothetical protein